MYIFFPNHFPLKTLIKGNFFQLLVRPLKMFIKTACCFPERITTKDYDSVLVELQDSEKVSGMLPIFVAFVH